MGDADRKKRAELKTVPKMKPSKASPTDAPTNQPATSQPRAPEQSATRAKRVAGKRGGLTEELGERVRRDPRREED